MDAPLVDSLWPTVPPELKYIEFRLPGTFRELVASAGFTNEEIGKIVRCLALDSDYFLTPKIEPEVYYYRKKLIERSKTRKRVENFRKYHPVDTTGGALTSTMGPVADTQCGVTVTPSRNVTVTPVASQPPSTHTPNEETPNNLLEKKPPIVPLEKNTPSSLEKDSSYGKRPKRKVKKLREKVTGDPVVLGGDLFSLVAGVDSGGLPGPEVAQVGAASQETRQGSPVARPDGSDGTSAVQYIERDSRGIGERPAEVPSPDSRDDAAWIPQKFAVFWEQYPRKVAKADALKAFSKIVKAQHNVDEFMTTLLASLAWWKTQDAWKKDKGKFIPHPTTWLNRGSWEDAVENAGANGASAQFLAEESDEELIRRMQGG